MKLRSVLTGMIVLLVVGVGLVTAAPLVTHDWESGAEPGWFDRDYFGSPNVTAFGNPGTVGGESGLRIVGGNTTPSESQIYNDGTGGSTLVSTFNGGSTRSIRFDFYADGAAPARLELYFTTSTGFSWYYQVNVSSGWNSYAINLIVSDDPGGWYSPDGRTAANFGTDMGNADEIGILLAYTTAGAGQVYGLDNFELNDEYLVPEPSTYAALAMALLSLGLVFRQKVSETIDRTVEAIKS